MPYCLDIPGRNRNTQNYPGPTTGIVVEHARGRRWARQRNSKAATENRSKIDTHEICSADGIFAQHHSSTHKIKHSWRKPQSPNADFLDSVAWTTSEFAACEGILLTSVAENRLGTTGCRPLLPGRTASAAPGSRHRSQEMVHVTSVIDPPVTTPKATPLTDAPAQAHGIQIVGAPSGTSPALLSWVLEVAELAQPDRVVFTDGSDDEWTRLTDALVARRHIHPADGQGELLLHRLRPDRRRPGRGPHLHLFGGPGRRRRHQQLDGTVAR